MKLHHEAEYARGIPVELAQLGNLALLQGDLNEARRRYTEVLLAYRSLDEPKWEALAWHQLGIVAQKACDWDEAERCYKEALTIRERFGDKAGAAQTCNQLAIVAKGAGRLEDAERWYKRAIEMNEERGDRASLAGNYNNLANLLLSQNRLDEAEAYAHRAREIKEMLDLSNEPWKTFNILAQIADKRGRAEDAREWRRKRDEAIAAFERQSGGQFGAAQQAAQVAQAVQQWEPVIADVVAVCKGNRQPLQRLEPFLQQMGQKDDWRNLVAVIRRILKGERDAALAEGLDNIDAAIVGRILEGLGNK